MSINKNTKDVWECECDIELIFVHISYRVLLSIVRPFALNALEGMVMEDRTNKKWGSVIARDSTWIGDRREINTLILEFIRQLHGPIQTVINSYQSPIILRLGIYHKSYEFTLRLNSKISQIFSENGIDLEISIYPSYEDA